MRNIQLTFDIPGDAHPDLKDIEFDQPFILESEFLSSVISNLYVRLHQSDTDYLPPAPKDHLWCFSFTRRRLEPLLGSVTVVPVLLQMTVKQEL